MQEKIGKNILRRILDYFIIQEINILKVKIGFFSYARKNGKIYIRKNITLFYNSIN